GQPVPCPQGRPGPGPPPDGRLDGPGRLRRGQRRHGVLLRPAPEERPEPPTPLGDPRRAPHRDRHLDRTHLPPPPTPTRPRPLDPHRIRNDHDPSDGNRRLTNPVPSTRGSPLRIVRIPMADVLTQVE